MYMYTVQITFLHVHLLLFEFFCSKVHIQVTYTCMYIFRTNCTSYITEEINICTYMYTNLIQPLSCDVTLLHATDVEVNPLIDPYQ